MPEDAISTFPHISHPPATNPPPSSSSFRNPSAATSTARTHHNSHDADTFYRTIWGGSPINIGLCDSPPQRPHPHRLSGYGGAARYLAKTYG